MKSVIRLSKNKNRYVIIFEDGREVTVKTIEEAMKLKEQG